MFRVLAVAVLFLLAGCGHKPAPVRTGPGGVVIAKQGPFQPNADLYLCPSSRITNAAMAGDDNRVYDFHPIVVVEGVVMATVPVNDACITSGFGRRWGRDHKGLDLQSRPAGLIYAAAPGKVLEAGLVSGFGNQVVIDHGRGVYTRYAHMEYIQPGIKVGSVVGFGAPIGKMGRSGNAQGIHLHYELLTGDYNNPKKAWGLITRDILSFPEYKGR